MITIDEDIKNKQYKSCYLFYGPEAYLRNQFKNKLKNALILESDTMNVNRFEGKGNSIGEMIDMAETLPFFADKRAIFIENSGLFSSAGEQMAEYLGNQSESTVMIFVEEEVDKRSKLFKKVQSKGKVVCFETPSGDKIKRWVLGILKKEKKKISEQAYELFLEKTGTNMSNISSELEKLICYTLDREFITNEDVEAVCVTTIANKIFEMVDAISRKQQKQALKLYYDLLSLKEPPMRILFLIARQFNILLQVKELKSKGLDNRSIAEKTGLRDFVVSKCINQSSQFTKKQLKQAVEGCVAAEENVKTGKMNDVMSVELVIIQYSQVFLDLLEKK